MTHRPSLHLSSKLRAIVGLSVGVAALASPRVVAAQEVPCTQGPCLRHRPSRATHFIAEIAGGATTYGSGGMALEALFGVGGKLRGFPPRFYLIAELAYNSGSTSGSSPLAGLGFTDDRTYRDISAGLRIYLPIYGPVRLFGDALVGGSHISASLSRQGVPGRGATGWMPLVGLASGVQLRLLHHLSLGLRARFIVTDDDIAGLRSMAGDASPTRVTATAGLTWHF